MVTQRWFKITAGAVGSLLVIVGLAAVLWAPSRNFSGFIIIVGLLLLLLVAFPVSGHRKGGR